MPRKREILAEYSGIRYVFGVVCCGGINIVFLRLRKTKTTPNTYIPDTVNISLLGGIFSKKDCEINKDNRSSSKFLMRA